MISILVTLASVIFCLLFSPRKIFIKSFSQPLFRVDFILVIKLILHAMLIAQVVYAFQHDLVVLLLYTFGLLMALPLQWKEHLYNKSSSGTLIFYHFILIGSILYWLYYDVRNMVLISIIVINLFVIILENFPQLKKRARYQRVYNTLEEDVDEFELFEECPEENSSFFARITFSWMNPLMKLGYSKPLERTDLWPLSNSNKSHKLSRDFEDLWHKNSPSLLKTLVKCYGSQFAFAGFFKLGQDILQFIQPQLLSRLIKFIESRNPLGDGSMDPQPISTGFIISALMLATGIVQSCLLHQYFHRCIVTGMHIKGGITTSIYRKSLRLSNKARQERTVGEMVNLMSVDAQRFMDLMTYLHIIWSGPLQITIALYLLFQTMGYSIFAGLIVMILMVPINGVLATRMRRLQKVQMENKDNRLKMMDEILSGIRVIKYYAWERFFQKSISAIRQKELDTLKSIGMLASVQTFTWACTPVLVSFATFATYAISSDAALTADKVFVSISLFNLLAFPLTVFPNVISGLVEASVSMKRVCTFLLASELETSYISHDHQKNGDEILSVKDGSFKWENNDVTLHDLNFSMNRKELLAVIGRVGSGKSSLINAILGEMYAATTNAKVLINTDHIAYVGQQAWIINGTLRDNILFGHEFNESFYQKVIQSCGLVGDLKILPGGDLTEIGERGLNLSGGQKQRISIARAVYSKAEFYLFDDSLSAVDSHLGQHIFQNVIGPKGILKDKARLFVTHGLHFVSECDNVIVMDDGRIVNGPCAPNLLVSDPNQQSTFLQSLKSFSKSAEAKDKKDEDKKDESYDTDKFNKVKPITGREENVRGSVDWAVYSTYAKACSFIAVFVAIILCVLSQGTSISINFWLKHWAEVNARLGENTNVTFYLIIYGVLSLVFSVFTVVQVIIIWIFCALKSSKSLHLQLLHSVLHAPMEFFDTVPIGRILNRFAKDLYTVDETLPRSFLSYFRTLFNVVGIIAVISVSTPPFLLLIIPLGLLYYQTQKYYLRSSRELKRLDSSNQSPIYSHFSESVAGQVTIRAFSQQFRFIRENETRLDTGFRAFYPSISSNRWLAMRLEFMGSLVIFGASLFAVIGCVLLKNVDAALAGLSVSYALTVTQTLNWMVRQACEIETNIVSVERIKEYIDLKQEEEQQVAVDGRGFLITKGSLEFQNFSCRYRDNTPLVLNDLSFKVKPGEKIGIVGKSGAGKSSILAALFRIIPAAAGRILIDSIDISTLSLQQLRSQLTIIPQDPVLFASSVRLNLDPLGLIKNDWELWQVLKQVYLSEKIKSMPGQLDAVIVQNGENFSVGERQLICLARALLKKTRLLVLDEATAAIDVETDLLIQQTIKEQFVECTVLTIAHRINTILSSDRVMVVDKGHLAEFDSPETLLADTSSIFYAFAKEANVVKQ